VQDARIRQEREGEQACPRFHAFRQTPRPHPTTSPSLRTPGRSLRPSAPLLTSSPQVRSFRAVIQTPYPPPSPSFRKSGRSPHPSAPLDLLLLQVRPFRAVIQTPRGPNTVALRNIGQLEFPFGASVTSDIEHRPTEECLTAGLTIQGGALRTFPFDATVDSVQVRYSTPEAERGCACNRQGREGRPRSNHEHEQRRGSE
jgi:hypothetical protein